MKTSDYLLMPDRIWSEYDGAPGGTSLASTCGELFSQQLFNWQEFAVAHMSMKGAWFREITSGQHTMLVQFNQGRTVSATAALDAETIRNRPCFLCVYHLPAAQKAVLYRKTFLILVNPYPIFSPHYTVVHVNHEPQELERHLGALLALAHDLGPAFMVFYNGPRCGASAPDHHHFQVCPSGMLPIEKDWEEGEREILCADREDVSFGVLRLPGRNALFMEGSVPETLEAFLKRLIGAMGEVMGSAEEPMLNLFCKQKEGRWQLLVFPRRKHRPDAYYREGKGSVLVTPGAVEMGGLLITIREDDFLKMTPALAEEIYREVSLPPEVIEEIVNRMK
ncbi:MAG: DUF4922 domain-containing protein [Deltaproteobacteria bacterium]|nr:DUF4922 domain-containing protein [Deltaproteobacteria bacterium]